MGEGDGRRKEGEKGTWKRMEGNNETREEREGGMK